MIYTPAEKQRMDDLLNVFGDYLASNKDVDVAYSEKTGYVRLIIGEHADSVFFQIPDFDCMLEMLFFDVLCDEVNLAMDRDRNLTNKTMDYRMPYNRLKVYVDALGPDREYAQKRLDEFIEKWKSSDLLP